MTTRCLQKLEELDRIAEHIYKKHSRQRTRGSVESRLESLRSRLQKHEQEIFGEFGSSSPSSPVSKARSVSTATRSTVSGNTSRVKFGNQSPPKKTKLGSARTTTPGKCTTPIKPKPRSRSLPSNVSQPKPQSKSTDDDKTQEKQASPRRPVSIYGRHNQGHESLETGWFNLKPGKSYGVIDAFACDEKNEKPLCYKINPKTGQCQRRLLKHRSPIRIGQNGITRDLSSVEDIRVDEGESEKWFGEDSGEDTPRKTEKKRTVPLSMEEQLNWENAHILTPRGEKSHHGETKNVHKQQPVIFNTPSQNKTDTTHSILKKTRPSKYRLCQESYSINTADGMGGSRNMVAVTIQDFSDLIPNEEVPDSPTDPSESIPETVAEEPPTNKDLVPQIVSRSSTDEPKEYVMFMEQRPEDVKVSICEPNRQDVKKSKSVTFPKLLVNMERDGSSKKIRPKSSDSGLQSLASERARRTSRPSTAPPSSPRTPYDVNSDMYEYISSYFSNTNFNVPKEENGLEMTEGSSDELTTGDLYREYSQCSREHVDPSRSQATQSSEPLTSDSVLSLQTSQNREIPQTENSEVQGNTALTDEVTATAVESEESLVDGKSSMDALSSLRRKIKQDLEKQTKELEQDIQDLYLKQKSTTALSDVVWADELEQGDKVI